MKNLLIGLCLIVLSGVSFAGLSDPSQLSMKASTQITSSAAVTVVGNWSSLDKYLTKTIWAYNTVGAGNGFAATIEGSVNGINWATLDSSSLTGIGTDQAKTVTLSNALPYIRVRVANATAVGITTPEVWGKMLTN